MTEFTVGGSRAARKHPMKCFLLGVLGAILGFLGTVLVYSQYSDYRAAAQTSGWMADVEPAQRAVEANAVRLGALTGAGLGVAKPRFTWKGPEHFEVTRDGLILMQGGLSGQLIALVPSWGQGGVQWRCLGGSRRDVSGCKDEGVASPAPSAPAAPAIAGIAVSKDAGDAPCTVTAHAIGPLRLGMTLAAAQQAMPQARFNRTSDGEGVALVDVAMGGESLAVAYAGEEDAEKPLDTTRVLEHLETFSATCATPEGIRPGSTVEEAEAAYGPLLAIRRSEIESREYVEFTRQPPGLQFRLDYSGEFAEGRSESTRHAPGAKILSIAVSRP